MTQIATPREEHREQVFDVLRMSLNLAPTYRDERIAWLPIDRMRCAFEGDRIVATAGARDFRQWFGGSELEMSGVTAVATLPEHRGTGLATRIVRELLHEARDKGQAISALYPATLRPYRGLGYELAGTFTMHEISLADLPAADAGPLEVEELDVIRDLDGVRACYVDSARHQAGPIDCDDPDWWPERILRRGWTDDVHRAVVARGGRGNVEAYASFTQKKAGGENDFAFLIDCKHLVASTVEGYASLLTYFRGFRGLGLSLRFVGPPAHPLSNLVEEQRVRPEWTFRWMLRLLDVPAALEQRGYPPVSNEAVIAVEDAQFPENLGPWRVIVDQGTVKVERTEAARQRPIAIGTLSAMFSGFLSPFDAVTLGLLDPTVAPFLAQLFAGPAPWMHDFF